MTTAATTRIPFLDLKAAYDELATETDAAIKNVLDSGRYILGEAVEQFESSFAGYCGATQAIGVGNGLDALLLLFKAAGIGPGDDVIVPSHTFIATWLAVTHCGANIVSVAVDPQTANLDPAQVEAAITPKTKAIVAVHLYGQTADMAPLKEIAQKHSLYLFEDAAQAHGARYNGYPAGSLSDGAAFSFYPGKNLGALGDGGAVVTSNDQLAKKIRQLRNYGSSVKYQHDMLGYNSRLDPIQAAILSVRLAILPQWNSRRQSIAQLYLDKLSSCDGLQLPHVPAFADPVWHLFVVQTEKRDALQQYLLKNGIETLIHYPIACDQQGAYKGSVPVCPVAGTLAKTVLSLPIGPHLSLEQANHVAEAVQAFFKAN